MYYPPMPTYYWHFLTHPTTDRIVIVIVMIVYCLIGIEISRLRDDFKLTSDDHIALTSNSANSHPFDNPDYSVTTTVESHSSNRSARMSKPHITSQSSVEHISTPRPPPNHNGPLNSRSPKQRRVSFKQYILMPSLFFLAMLATWVTPTINRVSALIRPNYESYSLLLAVSALGSLRGFWNGIIFITMGMKGWKRQTLERRTVTTKVSVVLFVFLSGCLQLQATRGTR